MTATARYPSGRRANSNYFDPEFVCIEWKQLADDLTWPHKRVGQ